jgi:hypothetical protein
VSAPHPDAGPVRVRGRRRAGAQGPRGWSDQRACTLTATGANVDGHKEILVLQVTTAEDGAGWLSFLRDRTARGLSGSNGLPPTRIPAWWGSAVRVETDLRDPALWGLVRELMVQALRREHLHLPLPGPDPPAWHHWRRFREEHFATDRGLAQVAQLHLPRPAMVVTPPRKASPPVRDEGPMAERERSCASLRCRTVGSRRPLRRAVYPGLRAPEKHGVHRSARPAALATRPVGSTQRQRTECAGWWVTGLQGA